MEPAIARALEGAVPNGSLDPDARSQVVRCTVGRSVGPGHRGRPMIVLVVVGA